MSLFIVYATLAHLSGVFSGPNEVSYMDIVYPVFSMFALLSLHMFMYGCNLFTWKQARINYNFIFEFQSSTALKYRDAFLICTTTMTAVVGALVIHLILGLSGFSPVQVDYIPGLLLLVSSSISKSWQFIGFSHCSGFYLTSFFILFFRFLLSFSYARLTCSTDRHAIIFYVCFGTRFSLLFIR